MSSGAKALFDDAKESNTGTLYSLEYRQAIAKLGDHSFKHPNYISHAEKQTVPLGYPRAEDSFPFPTPLYFGPPNGRMRQQVFWEPGESGMLSGKNKPDRRPSAPGDNSTTNFCMKCAMLFLFGAAFIALFVL
jgi:hypothetical protein